MNVVRTYNPEKDPYNGRYVPVTQKTEMHCGHMLETVRQPKTNCHECWNTWFLHHPGFVASAQSIEKVFGYKQLIAVNGVKATKQLKRFLHIMQQEGEQIVQEATA